MVARLLGRWVPARHPFPCSNCDGELWLHNSRHSLLGDCDCIVECEECGLAELLMARAGRL